MPERRSEKKNEKSSVMQDLLDQLERINRQFPGSRLLVDLARDAGLELARSMGKKIKRLRGKLERSEARSHTLQSRLADMLHELSTSTAALPIQEGQIARETDDLIDRFRKLRDESYPALARVLRDLTKQTSRTTFVRFLAEEILYRAAPIIAEHQLRHAHRIWSAEAEEHFLSELRSHVVGRVNRSLARTAGLQVMPALGKHLDAMISSSLEVLLGLMTSSPQARLVVPPIGTPLDMVNHVVRQPDKAGDSPAVGAVLFPGLLLLETPPRTIVPTIVHAIAGRPRPSSASIPAASPPTQE